MYLFIFICIHIFTHSVLLSLVKILTAGWLILISQQNSFKLKSILGKARKQTTNGERYFYLSFFAVKWLIKNRKICSVAHSFSQLMSFSNIYHLIGNSLPHLIYISTKSHWNFLRYLLQCESLKKLSQQKIVRIGEFISKVFYIWHLPSIKWFACSQ